MRRFWLLVLALVMPLQMSWAAVHLCNDPSPGISTAAPAAHDHANASAQDKDSHGQPEACCGAAHGCHGLHTIMAPTAPGIAVVPGSFSIATHEVQMAQRQFADRHERPQWPAA